MECDYNSLGEIIVDAAEMFEPPKRLSVAQAAEEYRYLNNPGSYVGKWRNDKAPYLVEPMESLTDRTKEAVIFVGPAQAGKTELSLNWVAYSVVCDPMDMLLIDKSNVAARDFSKRRVDRMHRHSREVGSRMLPRSDADNTFDKYYRSGMILSLSWPSIAELSGRPIGRVALMDYDRMPMDVDGNGSPFDLARKRTTSFMSAAMTLAESSPGFTVEDAKWMRRTPHEAPPTTGILALYNRGDMRRWYWQCEACLEWYEPEFANLKYLDKNDILTTSKTTKMVCPHCGNAIGPEEKPKQNMKGRWVPDGATLNAAGEMQGNPIQSNIVSYWLRGPAANFSTWEQLVNRYLTAEQEFLRTGSEESLKATVNTDQGDPYYPRGSDRERIPDELKEQALDSTKHIVPEYVRFLIATADVQKNRWEIQIHGVYPGKPYGIEIIDRFSIIKSERLDEDGERLWVKPASFLEDWDLLESQVMEKLYETEGGKMMGITFLGCDSGGRAGVTEKAYDWYRKLRKEGAGEHRDTFLIKGDPLPKSPRASITFPDSKRKDRHAGGRGEIPVLLLNSNLLKDQLQNMIERNDKELPALTYPRWLPDEWFSEMCVEVRTMKGWENPKKARNEAWDLCYYAIGICIHKRVDRINWDNPPDFAKPQEKNPKVYPKESKSQNKVAKNVNKQYSSISDLAASLA